jgi:hypothetical protein
VMRTMHNLKIVVCATLVLLFVACSSVEPQSLETPNVEATVQFRLSEERSKSDAKPLPPGLGTSVKPSPTNGGKEPTNTIPAKIPTLPAMKSPIPVASPTPIVALVTIQIPSPSPTYALTASPTLSPTQTKRHALYINNIQVQSGQMVISIQYGSVQISDPPDDDNLYEEGKSVDWEINPTTPNSEIDFLWGLEPTEGASGTILISGEYRVLVKISPPPLPTPTPTPPSIRRSGTPTPTPIFKFLTISPDCSERGSMLEITGTGFEAAAGIALTYVSGSNTSHLGTVTSDSNGAFSAMVMVPTHVGLNEKDSSNSITAASATGGSRTASHRAPRPSIATDVSGQAAGKYITVSGTDFTPGDPVNSMTIGGIIVEIVPNLTVSTDGSFSVTVAVPDLNVGLQTISGRVGSMSISGPVDNSCDGFSDPSFEVISN